VVFVARSKGKLGAIAAQLKKARAYSAEKSRLFRK